MLDFEPIFEFSRQNCSAICAFLVPANLLTTLISLVLLAKQSPLSKVRLTVTLSVVFALTLFLHISTWFMIGVVTPITFILFTLGSTCLAVNFLAIIYQPQFLQLVRLASERLAPKARSQES
ncbi:hypothetical protein STA3757_38970 [Stanieria sp. NIES-3757]|nr:hypothetical protein STA3757_38970 [Stanieria sp. NIES-3757]